jgi:hypothetical protein
LDGSRNFILGAVGGRQEKEKEKKKKNDLSLTLSLLELLIWEGKNEASCFLCPFCAGLLCCDASKPAQVQKYDDRHVHGGFGVLSHHGDLERDVAQTGSADEPGVSSTQIAIISPCPEEENPFRSGHDG